METHEIYATFFAKPLVQSVLLIVDFEIAGRVTLLDLLKSVFGWEAIEPFSSEEPWDMVFGTPLSYPASAAASWSTTPTT